MLWGQGGDLGQPRAHAPERHRGAHGRRGLALEVCGIKDDPVGGAARMRGDDRGAGQDLHVTGAAPHLDLAAEMGEGHRVGVALEVHRAVLRHAAGDGDVEGLGQHRGQRAEQRTLLRPGIEHPGAGGRTGAFAQDLEAPCVGVGLQSIEAVPVPAVGTAAQPAVADAPLDLALGLGAARGTGIDVKTQRLRIAPVDRVDRSEGTGPGDHGGLLVVDPDRRRDPAEAHQRGVVNAQPRQQVLAFAPHQCPGARVRQLQDEGEELPLAAADPHPRDHRPVGLGLGPGRGLHAAPRPARRRREDLADVVEPE